MPTEFGFQLTPDISAAEREAVSTRPHSALQQAIRRTQANPGFFSPSQLLAAGPGAFEVEREAEERRRNLGVTRAQQGLSLSGQAINARGSQVKHDARRIQEQEHADFLDRMDGLSPREAWAESTARDLSNPLNDVFLRKYDALDAARKGAGKREVDYRMNTEPELAVTAKPKVKEALANIAEKDILLKEKRAEQMFYDLADSDPSDPLNITGIVAEALPDIDPSSPVFSEQISALQQRLQSPETSDPTRKGMRLIGDVQGVMNKLSTLDSRMPLEEFDSARSAAMQEILKTGGLSVPTATALQQALFKGRGIVAKQQAKELEQKREYQTIRNNYYERRQLLAEGASDEEIRDSYDKGIDRLKKLRALHVNERLPTVEEVAQYGWDPEKKIGFKTEGFEELIEFQKEELRAYAKALGIDFDNNLNGKETPTKPTPAPAPRPPGSKMTDEKASQLQKDLNNLENRIPQGEGAPEPVNPYIDKIYGTSKTVIDAVGPTVE